MSHAWKLFARNVGGGLECRDKIWRDEPEEINIIDVDIIIIFLVLVDNTTVDRNEKIRGDGLKLLTVYTVHYTGI